MKLRKVCLNKNLAFVVVLLVCATLLGGVVTADKYGPLPDRIINLEKIDLRSPEAGISSIEDQLIRHKVGVYTRYQETNYWCAPAACQQLLNARGIQVSQAQLALDLGTTVAGTNYVESLPPVLNSYIGWAEHPAPGMPGYRTGYTSSNNDYTLRQRLLQDTATNDPLIYNVNLAVLYPGISGYHYVTGNGWRELNGQIYDVIYVDPWAAVSLPYYLGEKACDFSTLSYAIHSCNGKYVW